MKILKTKQDAYLVQYVYALLAIWLWCAWGAGIAAQVTIPVTYLPLEGEKAGIEPAVLILKDKDHLLNKQQVWDALQTAQFQLYSDFEKPGKFEFGQYSFWMVFVLENRSADTLDLLVRSQSFKDTIWLRERNAYSVAVCMPTWFPVSLERPLLPYQVKELDCLRLGPYRRDTFLAVLSHYKAFSSLVPQISLPEAYESYRMEATQYSNLFYFLFIGAMGTVCLFSIAQYIQHSDRTFLWYALYLGSLIFVAWRNIEDDNPWLYSTYYIAPWGWTKVFHSAAHFCCYTLFVYYFLKQGEEKPVYMRNALRLVLGLSLLACASELILLSLSWLYQSWLLYFFYRTSLTTLAFFFLWLLWRKGGALARVIFAGTLCALLGEFTSLFLGKPWATFSGAIGTVLEIGFFSFGLAYRSRLFRKEHNRLQIRHIRQLEENERLRDIERREEVEAFKNRFYANITHEFRTPLTVMLGMSESLRESPDAQAREAGRLVARNGHNLLRLVNQLLDLSKIESGALQLHPVHADVMKFVQITAESFESLAAMKNQRLSVQTAPGRFMMDFDPDRLQQVLSNLMGNALKFTPEGGEISVVCSIGTRSGHSVSMLQIEVRDTGIGISAEALPHILDRFYRDENNLPTQTEGTGIGLALVKELLALMQGEMEVESRVGEGSLFRVWLPVFNDELGMMNDELSIMHTTTSINPTTTAAPHSSFIVHHSSFPLLLLVEDNPDLVQYLRSILDQDYQLITASNGREALEQAFEHLPDIVLSDVMMPGMDGLEFCRTLKNDQRSSHIPVVMLTARATVGDKITGLQHGADAWLTKPFDRAELFATLAAMLESRRRLRTYFEHEKAGAPAAELASLVQKENEFLQRVRTCIDAHLDDDAYDIPQLCLDLAMSRMQLHRKLSALGAPSAALFIRNHRLSRAQVWLKTTELTVSEVAFKTGFSDPAYFSRCFREAFGKSPSEWRNV